MKKLMWTLQVLVGQTGFLIIFGMRSGRGHEHPEGACHRPIVFETAP